MKRSILRSQALAVFQLSLFAWGACAGADTGLNAASAPAQAPMLVHNATELRDLLLAGRSPAELQVLTLNRGCGPSGCVVDFGGYSLDRERGRLRTAAGAPVKLVHHGAGVAELPPLDRDPLGAYAVLQGGTRWGVCLELAHTGLWRSGARQRWVSVILLPDTPGSRGAAIGHRWVGYWAGCDSLSAGAGATATELPILNASSAGMQLRWQRCTARGCVSRPGLARFSVVPGAPGGALSVTTP